MADPELLSSWERTTKHLQAARSCLGPLADDSERWYAEYLDHNELALAFEVLVSAADAEAASADCWAALQCAASEMRLPVEDEAVQLLRKHLPVRLPDVLSDRVQAFPETHYGVQTITVTLRDGRVFSGVEVAWGSEVIRVRGQAKLPFSAEEIVDVDDASGLT